MINTQTGQRAEGCDVAKQYFKDIPEEFMDKLILQGDVLKCAGGFTIEHMTDYLSMRDGEMETIMGLPKTLTYHLIQQVTHV